LAEQDTKKGGDTEKQDKCPYCGRAKGPGMCMFCDNGIGKTTGSISMPKVTSKAPVDKFGKLDRSVRGPTSIN
jgi:hypothetical protein